MISQADLGTLPAVMCMPRMLTPAAECEKYEREADVACCVTHAPHDAGLNLDRAHSATTNALPQRHGSHSTQTIIERKDKFTAPHINILEEVQRQNTRKAPRRD